MKILETRTKAIIDHLMAAYNAGSPTPTACMGQERELIVSGLLKRVFPPMFRFGNGAIIDRNNIRTGQLDIVIESPNYFSLPFSNVGPRIYFCEGVSAVIEVKSTLDTTNKKQS